MKRNKFSLSNYQLFTMGMGLLRPISWYEALPGDTIQQRVNLLLRMTPLTAPVMHPVKVRIHTFFVPNRLMWSDWEDFITGGEDGTFEAQPPSYTLNGPLLSSSLHNALGIPIGDYTGKNVLVSMLPYRAYGLIYNQFYRDQDLIDKVNVSTASGNDTVTNRSMQRISWEKDFYTTARPWTSKGDDILIPIGDTAPVIRTAAPQWYANGEGVRHLEITTGNDVGISGSAGVGSDVIDWDSPGLAADLAAATGITVNDLRAYLAQQRYQEARARFGSRYSEYLKYLAPGIGNLDARLQEPEYLGGGSAMVSFSEVLQTQRSDTDETPLGTMGGHAISLMRTRRFRRFIPEHGIVMTLMSVVPKAIYTQQFERKWHRLNKEMYYQKELEFIGEEPVTNREVYINHSDPTGVFGYVPRYDSYKYIPSQVRGEFEDTQANWHYSRIFSGDVALNKSFIECNPAQRPSADQTGDPLYVMANFSIQARRIMAKWATPRTF